MPYTSSILVNKIVLLIKWKSIKADIMRTGSLAWNPWIKSRKQRRAVEWRVDIRKCITVSPVSISFCKAYLRMMTKCAIINNIYPRIKNSSGAMKSSQRGWFLLKMIVKKSHEGKDGVQSLSAKDSTFIISKPYLSLEGAVLQVLTH